MKAFIYESYEFQYYRILRRSIDSKYSLDKHAEYLEDTFNIPYTYYDTATRLSQVIEFFLKRENKLRFCL